MKVYINKIENRGTIKIKTGYCMEHLTPKWNYVEALKIR